MSAQCEITARQAVGAPMSIFERYLTVWVILCIVTGIVLGQFLPGVFQAIGRMEQHGTDQGEQCQKRGAGTRAK